MYTEIGDSQMVAGYERDPDDRIKDLEDAIHGDGTEPGLAGKIDLFGRFVVQTNKRLERLEPPAGQPRDWFLVDNPETAAQWLDELHQWQGRVLNHVRPALVDVPCWRWHPSVVGRLIVLHGLWLSAKRPDQAALLWTRYLADLAGAVSGELKKCRESGKHRGHDCGHVTKQPDGTVVSDWIVDETADHELLRADYIEWWCGSREGIPPGLMPA